MSIRFAVLGSGSGGNATLVLFEGGVNRRCALIDAGLSPRETTRRLKPFGLHLRDLHDVLITHLDRDHFGQGWIKASRRFNIRMHVHRRHYRRCPFQMTMGAYLVPFDGTFELRDASIRIEPIHLAHDALGSVGFIIEHAEERLGFATDLGRVPDHLYDAFERLDYLAIESNYDRDMQLQSGRPANLKRRIMGGTGHLSNRQSLEAVLRIAGQSRLRHVVLLHLSRQCNRPELIEELYDARARSLRGHLTITSQFDPTPMLSAAAREPAAPAEHAYAPCSQGLLFAT